ncbi:MAG: hypothetical protein WCV63_01480 [Negativicutes bacterium]|jgi:hydrogenase-4 component E
MNALFLQLLLTILFLSIVFLHITKKNFAVSVTYGVQSMAIVILMIHSFFVTGEASMLLIIGLIFTFKVIIAPIFLVKLIKRHKLTFSVSTYLNTPLTLIIIAILTAIAYSQSFAPLTNIIPDNKILLQIALSALFLSLFLIINRKGAISKIIGILALENSIVAFAIFAGLEQSSGLQIGIVFDIFIWFTIAAVFLTMIHKQFGSLDTAKMRHLKD